MKKKQVETEKCSILIYMVNVGIRSLCEQIDRQTDRQTKTDRETDRQPSKGKNSVVRELNENNEKQ